MSPRPDLGPKSLLGDTANPLDRAAERRTDETFLAAAAADDEFHRLLTSACDNAHLLEVVDLIREALVSYERAYLLSRERLERSVSEHEAIGAALERGDDELAAERVRENFTSGLPGADSG